MLIGIICLMCYNLITKYAINTGIEHFESSKLNKLKKNGKSKGEKFSNLNIKANKKRKEKFDDVVSSNNKSFLNKALTIFNSNRQISENKNDESDSGGNNNNEKAKKRKNKYTIEDVINRSEKLQNGISQISADYLKQQAVDYYKSFKKEKFSAKSDSTADSFEKLNLYKEKFFDIFK